MRASLLVLIAACGIDVEQPVGVRPDPRVSWYGDIGPIVADRCMGCHQTNGIAPFALQDYDDAAPLARRMLSAVRTGLMPPWSAGSSTDCAPSRPWKDDPRLTADEIALLGAWIDGGLEVGTPTPLVPHDDRLADATRSLTVAAPHVTSGTRDELICYPLDPGLAGDAWLTGWEAAPGNPDVVHHVIVQPLPPNLLAAAKSYDLVGKEVPCEAFLDATQTIGAWTPGQEPFEAPAGVGQALPAGTGIWLQIHYHPGGRINAPDATTINLRTIDTAPQHTYVVDFFGNATQAPLLLPDPDDRAAPEFRIPAQVSAHVETMVAPIYGGRLPLFLAQPHMHYLGTHLQVFVDRSHAAVATDEPVHECLIDSSWNFDWQRTYSYATPFEQLPTIGQGDVVTVRCTYDNTLANPFAQRALHDQGLGAPVDVFLGEGKSTDEMCLALFGKVMP